MKYNSDMYNCVYMDKLMLPFFLALIAKKVIPSDQFGEFSCSAWSPDHHYMQSQQGEKCENWQ